jgi:hypothetical protein
MLRESGKPLKSLSVQIVVVIFVEFEEVNTCVGGPSTPAPH